MADKPIKTRERILLAALDLFNEEGERNVTTVDIANEIDISPGNLYYHFHGKEIILEELYARFDQRMRNVLTAPIERPLSTEDTWYYLYVVFEEIYAFRFLYANLSDLVERDQTIGRKFSRLLDVKRKTARAVFDRLSDSGILSISADEIDLVVESVVLTLTYWMTFCDLDQTEHEAATLIHRGVLQIMSIVAPYLGDNHKAFYAHCLELFREAEKTAVT